VTNQTSAIISFGASAFWKPATAVKTSPSYAWASTFNEQIIDPNSDETCQWTLTAGALGGVGVRGVIPPFVGWSWQASGGSGTGTFVASLYGRR
jgi:hypothetical protein